MLCAPTEIQISGSIGQIEIILGMQSQWKHGRQFKLSPWSDVNFETFMLGSPQKPCRAAIIVPDSILPLQNLFYFMDIERLQKHSVACRSASLIAGRSCVSFLISRIVSVEFTRGKSHLRRLTCQTLTKFRWIKTFSFLFDSSLRLSHVLLSTSHTKHIVQRISK
jgi:hypothetical protein